jgi:hypothetical protein
MQKIASATFTNKNINNEDWTSNTTLLAEFTVSTAARFFATVHFDALYNTATWAEEGNEDDFISLPFAHSGSGPEAALWDSTNGTIRSGSGVAECLTPALGDGDGRPCQYTLAIGILDGSTTPITLRIRATSGVSGDNHASGEVTLWATDIAGEGINADDIKLIKQALVGKRTHAVETGINTVYDDDGTTPLVTLTPSEQEGVVTIDPS